MKKNLTLLSALLMSTLVSAGLASCNSSSQPSSSGDQPIVYDPLEAFDTKTPVTIKFYSIMGTKPKGIFDAYVKKFQEIYPNITVDHTAPGGYDELRDKIKTELSSTEGGPDLAYCYPDHVALYNLSKKVRPLDRFINDPNVGLSAEQKGDFVEGFYNEGKQFGDGLMYTLPFVKSTEVLYYNKTVFDKEGLSVPTHWFSTDTNDKTSMEYVCATLKQKYPTSTPLGYDSEANWFITMTEQLKTPYTAASADKNQRFLFNTPENRDFVKKFGEWRKKGWFTTQKLNNAYSSELFINTDATKSTAYMSIGSSAGAQYQAPATSDPTTGGFEVGIASIPQADASNPKVISQGPSICMFKSTNAQKEIASWLFLKYITTTVELQGQFSMESGYVPVIKSVFSNETYKEFTDGYSGLDPKGITALSAKVCGEQANAYYTSPAFVGSSEARDQVGNLMLAVFNATGEITDTVVSKAFEDAVKKCVDSVTN